MPQAPSEEEPEKILLEFGKKIGKLDIPVNMEIGVIRSKIVKRPTEIERVVEELFEVSERVIIYTPIYEVCFQNMKNGAIKTVKINGITAKAIS